ncbi:GAF domain-containing protein [Streptomyces sp. QTS52]
MESLQNIPIGGTTERQLLQSVVAVARYVYGAAASSVFTVSPATGELVFAAVAGKGEEGLVGKRFAPGTGIAGLAVASGQPLIADNVAESDQFAREAAASTGYIPSSIMAAPLIADGESIGVLSVLDRHTNAENDPSRELDDTELLGLLATQAALSLALLRRSEQGACAVPHMGELLARLSEHVVVDSSDPLALALLSVSLDLLERRTPLTATPS